MVMSQIVAVFIQWRLPIVINHLYGSKSLGQNLVPIQMLFK